LNEDEERENERSEKGKKEKRDPLPVLFLSTQN
jgi:hypothetical protein